MLQPDYAEAGISHDQCMVVCALSKPADFCAIYVFWLNKQLFGPPSVSQNLTSSAEMASLITVAHLWA